MTNPVNHSTSWKIYQPTLAHAIRDVHSRRYKILGVACMQLLAKNAHRYIELNPIEFIFNDKNPEAPREKLFGYTYIRRKTLRVSNRLLRLNYANNP